MGLRSYQRAFRVMVLLAVPIIGGCASTTQRDASAAPRAQVIADHWPTWAGGEPSDTPARPVQPPPYPNVFDGPPPRNLPMLNAEQQTKAVADLDRMRNHVSDQIRAAKAFDDKNTATALSDATKGQLAAGDGQPPH